MVPGGRERTQREEELQRQVGDDSAQGPVVRAKKAPSAPSMDECDSHSAAGHAEYRGWCPFCVAGATMGIQNFIRTMPISVERRSDFNDALTTLNRLHQESGEEQLRPIPFWKCQQWHPIIMFFLQLFLVAMERFLVELMTIKRKSTNEFTCKAT